MLIIFVFLKIGDNISYWYGYTFWKKLINI